MTARKKPIRLTRQRAEALLAIYAVGERDARLALTSALGEPDYDSMQNARARDKQLQQAADAAQIIRERYVDAPPKKDPEALF